MQLARLAATSTDIAGTRSRLAKRRFIATTIAEADPAEIELVVTYLSGSLRQRRTGVGWASLSSIPEPAAEPK
ncbi:MAG: ATP-dependent DNA ligase, partial [Mycobacterium sp.]